MKALIMIYHSYMGCRLEQLEVIGGLTYIVAGVFRGPKRFNRKRKNQ